VAASAPAGQTHSPRENHPEKFKTAFPYFIV